MTGTDPTTNPSSNSWDMAFKEQRRKGDLVYLFDMNRGVEILRMEKGAHHSGRHEVRDRAEPEGGSSSRLSPSRR